MEKFKYKEVVFWDDRKVTLVMVSEPSNEVTLMHEAGIRYSTLLIMIIWLDDNSRTGYGWCGNNDLIDFPISEYVPDFLRSYRAFKGSQ